MQSEVVEAYFRAELLYSHLLDLLNDASENEGDGVDNDRSGLETADLLLTLAQAERFVQAPVDIVEQQLERLPARMSDRTSKDKQSTAALLGLTPQSLRRAHGLESEEAMRVQEVVARQTVLPKLEQRLREQCTDVCQLAMPSLLEAARRPDAPGAPEAVSISRIAELPALLLELEARKLQLDRENEVIEQQLRAQLIKDVELCKEMATLITNMLVDHQRNDQARVLHTKIQWLVACSRAMYARAQVIADQLTVETYPVEHIQLLRASHDALQERKRRALEEREQFQAKLEIYRSGDAQYQEIARQYGIVLSGIEEKKNWLNSLNV